ncbi:transcription antitermination factor NusB [Miltoncostaea marina]|uniref:transcription antitermination factor NusB n=1 Tax=Miltoncostaea marina TaxID=2843215 RepID=UPI001C3D7B17|nr:transcription antitermination factor NusB [Miltoncostaea marina]
MSVAGREGGRRAARRQAVILLYQHDVTGIPLEELERNAARDGTPIDPFARALTEGVVSDTAGLDELITGAAEGWTAERLAPLERNILRVAVHEILDWEDIPSAVSINEAVDLAKRYCQSEAAGLVNGILGRIAADHAGVPR